MNLPLLRLLNDPNLPAGGNALDIGFGSGRDGLALVEKRFDVEMIDASQKKVDDFKRAHQDFPGIVQCADITEFDFSQKTYNCVVANNTLPFIASGEKVERVIRDVVDALNRGGFFLFTLFGPRDDWSAKSDMSFFEYEQALSLLKDLDVKMYFQSTEEGFGPMQNGEIKFWHIHRFVVQKV